MDIEIEIEKENINILNTNTIEESKKKKDEAICKEIHNLHKYGSLLMNRCDIMQYKLQLEDQLNQILYRDYYYNNKEKLNNEADELFKEIKETTEKLKNLINNFNCFLKQIIDMSLISISKLYAMANITHNVNEMYRTTINLRYSIDNSNLEKFLKNLFYKEITDYINKTNEMQKFDDSMKILGSYFI